MKAGMRTLRHNHIPNYDDTDAAFRAIGRALARNVPGLNRQWSKQPDRPDGK